MVEYRLSLFLAIGQVLTILWHFEILKWESMGKPKMWNISTTANRSAKRTKLWDSRSFSAYMEGTFDARFLEFGLGSFGAFCKIFNFTIFETPLRSQFSPDSSKLYTVYHNHTGCHFFFSWRSAKRCKNYGILKYSLSRTICCYNFQSAISTTICHWSPSKHYDITLVTVVNLNAC